MSDTVWSIYEKWCRDWKRYKHYTAQKRRADKIKQSEQTKMTKYLGERT